jgi:hypothetical protein
MSTKSSPKKPGAKAQAKPAQAPAKVTEKKKTSAAGSKLATLVSVKDSVKNAIFGSGRNAPKAKQLEKTSPPKTLATSAKTSMKATPSKSKTPPPSKAAKAPAPVKAAPVKAAAPAKAGKAAAPAKAGKAAAPAKAGKAAAAATPPPAPVSAKGAKGKAAAPAAAAPATPAPKGKAGKTPVSPLLKASLSKTRSSRLHPDDVCRETACESLATALTYCRLHYIKNWKKIKRKEIILKEGKLNQYIEELVVKYPDKYIEAIRQDLASDKDFAQVIVDLDLDESVDDFEADGENAEGLIDNIKGSFDDEGDAF